MAKITVPLADGVYISDNLPSVGSPNDTFYHQVSLEVDGSPTTGTIEIKAKAPGSSAFESIPDGIVNLSSPHTILFQFNVESYEFTLSGSDVVDSEVYVSDQEFKGVSI